MTYQTKDHCKSNSKECCPTQDIENVLKVGSMHMLKYAQKLVDKKRLGYDCEDDIEQKRDKLASYLDVVKSEYKKIQEGYQPCIKCIDFLSLLDKVTSITGKFCDLEYSFIEVDESGKQEWVLDNPRCVSYEDWEVASYQFCDNIKLITRLESEQVCNLVLALKKEVICPDILLLAKVHKEACDLNLKVNRTLEECKIDFKLLHSQVECDLDLKTYLELIECKVSFDMIKLVYENKLSLCVRKTESDTLPCIETPLGEFPLDYISADPEAMAKHGLICTASEEDLKCDFK